MPPKQATLGKFFGQPNGTTNPQQSKLSFSAKPSSNGPIQASALKNDKMAVAENVDMKEEDTENASATKVEPQESEPDTNAGHASELKHSLPSRKRVASEAETDTSDDEPPVKRKRLQRGLRPTDDEETTPSVSPVIKAEPAASQTTSTPPAKSKTNGRKCVKFIEETPVGNITSSFIRKGTPKKPLIEETICREDDDDAVEMTEARPSAASSKKSPSPTPAECDLANESGSEHDKDIEDEKPAALAKARAKVQTTLSSATKDPYPDWTSGEPVPYAALCTTFSEIELTTKRLEISAHCSLFLRQVLRLTPKDLLPVVQLMVNKLAADYTGIELGIGESLIVKAIGESTGRSQNIIKADQKEIGDLGLVAAKSRSNQRTMFKPMPLTVRGVHQSLIAIATIEGHGAQNRKVQGIMKLLSSADAELSGKGIDITKNKGGPSEAKFIIRALEGKMRLGLAEKTAIVALAHAVVFHEAVESGKGKPSVEKLAEGESMLKSVFCELPSYEDVIPAMVEHGIFNLRNICNLRPGVPLKPMLAKPTKSITEVLDRFEGKDFSCEYKYDGERAQIHFVAHDADFKYATSTAVSAAGKSSKGISNIFSRNSEDLSKKYPDILEKLPTWVKEGTSSFVLDCETVAWDLEAKKVLPFQQLMTRKRKDVKAEDVKVKVCVFAFDILFLNGKALVNTSFRERRELLHSAFTEVESEFSFAKYGNTSELDTIQTLLDESISAACEGLMVKMLDGPQSYYEPSRRSQNWLKVKKDYLSGVGDSLDLVVIGAYFGKGKRTSVYGAFLLACYNSTTQNFETVCNIGTGFSEAVLEEFHTQLEEIVIDRPKPFYSHSAGNKDQPDVWFEPKYVWEVKTADLTLSPRYKAAASEMEGDKGISLRFPRFLKIRDDKKAEDATTSKAVAEMYMNQQGMAKNKGPSVDDDFEY